MNPANTTDVTTRIDPGRSFTLAADTALRNAREQLQQATAQRDQLAQLVTKLGAQVEAILASVETFRDAIDNPKAKRTKRHTSQPLKPAPPGIPPPLPRAQPQSQADQAPTASPTPPTAPSGRQAAYTSAARTYGKSAAICAATRAYIAATPANDDIYPRLLADHLVKQRLVNSLAAGQHYSYTLLASLTKEGALMRIASGRYHRVTPTTPPPPPHTAPNALDTDDAHTAGKEEA
jgi:hypothetical protein